MLKQRVITGVILFLIVAGLLFFAPVWLYAACCSLILLYAAWEWSALIRFQSKKKRLLYLLLVAWLMLFTTVVTEPFAFKWMALAHTVYLKQIVLVLHYTLLPCLLHLAMIWWIFSLALICSYPDSRRYWSAKPIQVVISLLILLSFWVSLLVLRLSQAGEWVLFYGLTLVWVTDCGAYFTGKRFGAIKLAPNVSPGKTVEGILGGAISAVIMGLILPYGSYLIPHLGMFRPQETFKLILLISLVVLAAVVGDLFESMLKRHCGVKDSGSIFPGHGGLLDRIDALLAAIPVYATILMLMSPAT